jgi:methylmalonyl-CoA decarboxylase subunit alpha
MGIKAKIADLFDRTKKIFSGGGEKALEKQQKMGKLFARDRIKHILDPNTFNEIDLFVEHDCSDFGMDTKVLNSDGVITGIGKVNGNDICIYAQDFTVAGGSLGYAHAQKITKMQDLALQNGVPIVGINDSGGARIQEGVNALAGYGDIFYRNTLASGVVPQLSVILGPCAGGAVYSPALTDFVFVVDQISKMFITGPDVIKTVLGEEISQEELGGAKIQNAISGNAHFFAASETECFQQIATLLSYLPPNNQEKAKPMQPKDPKHPMDIEHIIPPNANQPYDMIELIKRVVDDSEFFQVHEHFAKNIVVGFARLDGETVGIVGNQPKYLAGVLDIDSSDKAARFIRFCDSFNIPLITFVDIPGYLPGIDQEHGGVIRHGAKMLYSYSEATVPKMTVIVRKAYGGGYIAMCSRHLGADFLYAWPTAEIAVMGPEGAANIIFRNEIKDAENPEEVRQQKIKEYQEKFANPYVAASQRWVDGVIDPIQTRPILIQSLHMCKNKRVPRPEKKHGVPPF